MHMTKQEAHTGYSTVPAGHIATVVTCLEMTEKPESDPTKSEFPEGITLESFDSAVLDDYRRLYRRVGEEWLWFSRLVMDDASLSAILHDSAVEVYVLRKNEMDIGILELDFRQSEECELVFFGLTPDVTGLGLGSHFINKAIELAWSKPVRRFWVHTCTFDHPAALKFYIRSGFKPFALEVEVKPDPRLSGHLAKTSAPHVPLIPVD